MSSLSDEERKERKRAGDRRRYATNRESLLGRQRLYYLANKDRENERTRQWKLDNPARVLEQNRQRYEANKEYFYAQNRLRRARLLAVPSSPYSTELIVELYGSDCHLCGVAIDLSLPRHASQGEGWEMGLHLDHLVPVSKNGPDTPENVRPAHALCNLVKGNR